MHRSPFIRFLTLGIAVLAAGSTVLLALLVINAGHGFAGCTVTMAGGWWAPIVSGLVVGGVTWALLSLKIINHHRHYTIKDGRCTCPACGGTILGDWRLCPHCGAQIAPVHGDTPQADRITT